MSTIRLSSLPLLLFQSGGGGGNNGVDNNQVELQAEQAAQAQAQQQAQWEAEQAQQQQAAQVSSDQANQQLKTSTANQISEANQYQQANNSQGAAQNATGGPSGIKAAATMSENTLSTDPATAKLQAAGVSIPGITSLQNLLQKRTLQQSNVVPAAGNSLNTTTASLGG